MKRKLRIIVLLHESLNPPLDIDPKESYDKDWRTEFAVIHCLRYLDHDVEVIPISNDLNPNK